MKIPFTTNFEDVEEFHRTFDVPPAWKGGLMLNQQVMAHRHDLIVEEVQDELFPALQRLQVAASLENLTEVADALVDSVYVLLGTAVALDLPWETLWREVHRSNMAKVQPDGTVLRREDGKILKPTDWVPPDLHNIILEWHADRSMLQSPELTESYTIARVKGAAL